MSDAEEGRREGGRAGNESSPPSPFFTQCLAYNQRYGKEYAARWQPTKADDWGRSVGFFNVDEPTQRRSSRRPCAKTSWQTQRIEEGIHAESQRSEAIEFGSGAKWQGLRAPSASISGSDARGGSGNPESGPREEQRQRVGQRTSCSSVNEHQEVQQSLLLHGRSIA